MLDAAAGLTRYEAEGAFALSLARHDVLRPESIWELKAQALKKNNLLALHRGRETFSDLGGLDNLKDFCRRALQPGKSVKARGVLLLGVPGSGKSFFAKALGNETGRPTLLLDLGSLYGSLVGSTEANVPPGSCTSPTRWHPVFCSLMRSKKACRASAVRGIAASPRGCSARC